MRDLCLAGAMLLTACVAPNDRRRPELDVDAITDSARRALDAHALPHDRSRELRAFSSAGVAVGNRVAVRAPRYADEGFTLREVRSGLEVVVRLVGARHELGAAVDGWFVYQAGARDGAMFLRATEHGAEDFVVSNGAREEYEVELGVGVAALRLVSGVLEFLDEHGTPRLRMNEPYVVDANGVRHVVNVDIGGCAHDNSAALPFDRPIIAPGARRCTIALRWSEAVRRPVLLDPSWATTTTMSVPRLTHVAVALNDNRVLIAGGYPSAGARYHSTAEVFDAVTRTWTMAGAMSAPRAVAAAARIGVARVLIAGGVVGYSGETLSTAEIYDATDGWRSSTSMNMQRSAFALARLGDRVLAAGGGSTAELFEVSTATWMMIPALSKYAYVNRLHVVGTSSVLNYDGADSSSAQLWNGISWTPAGNTSRPAGMSATLRDGRVLAVGGQYAGGSTMAEIWSAAMGWRATAPLPVPLQFGRTMATAANGMVVVGGGRSGGFPLSSAALFDPTTEKWSVLPPMSRGREGASATAVGNGLLIAGGQDQNPDPITVLSTAEFFAFDPIGTKCSAARDCASGFCTDGVCCDAACTGPCESCALPGKVGRCTAVAGAPVHGTCGSSGSPPCAPIACDGSDGKACRIFPGEDTVCGLAECRDGYARSAPRCDGMGTCVPRSDVPCAPFACVAGACATECADDLSCAGGMKCDVATGRCRPAAPAADAAVGNGDAEDGDVGQGDTAIGSDAANGSDIVVACTCDLRRSRPRASLEAILGALSFLAWRARSSRRAERGS